MRLRRTEAQKSHRCDYVVPVRHAPTFPFQFLFISHLGVTRPA